MKRKNGLTLVELIVVIGLIAFIAAAFIFPAFQRARGRAYDVVCLSNLRQIGQALLMYAQDNDGLIPPYSNLGSLKAKRWRSAFDPYVQDKGIFFCPNDPFAGLPPNKTLLRFWIGSDHSVTSYRSCMATLGKLGKGGIDIEEMFTRGYYLKSDIYHNIVSFPQNWLLWAEEKEFFINWWVLPIIRLHHGAAVYLYDYTHFIEGERIKGDTIELFCDGSVDFHLSNRPCFVWKMLENHFKQLGGDQK